MTQTSSNYVKNIHETYTLIEKRGSMIKTSFRKAFYDRCEKA